MTIRTRLGWWFAGLLTTALILVAALSYDELVAEAGTPEGLSEPLWWKLGEIAIRSGIPLSLLGLGAWWLLRRSLSPITTLTEKAEHIHIHNLSERLPRSGNGDELDRLTEVFNAMTARLDNSFRSIREFTLNASHELKTPLAVLHGEIETALNDPSTTPAQREAYGSQLDEIQRLTKIVESLSLLAKADAGQMVLAKDPLRLDELVRDSFADAQILAQSKQINVTLGDCDEVTVRGDRHRLRQLLLNLTDNAIKYNQPKGRVNIVLKRNGTRAEFTIANTGPGIPPTVLSRVFDRFFRGDESRNREVEGCGLGLSIAQWIVRAHGGDIEITSQPERLTTVSVKLPLQPA
jgi:signal transduction histidine kinase